MAMFFMTNSQKKLSLGGTIFSKLLYQLSGRGATNRSARRAPGYETPARVQLIVPAFTARCTVGENVNSCPLG
jgi:hypothetical protein